MPMPDAATAASNWANAMASASTKYSAAIQRVTDNPMAKAAANQAGYLAGVQANVSKWVAGLQRVSTQFWQTQCVQLGAARLGSGAAAAKPKVQAFMTTFLPFLQGVVGQIKSMPNDSYAARKARANAYMDAVHAFKR